MPCLRKLLPSSLPLKLLSLSSFLRSTAPYSRHIEDIAVRSERQSWPLQSQGQATAAFLSFLPSSVHNDRQPFCMCAFCVPHISRQNMDTLPASFLPFQVRHAVIASVRAPTVSRRSEAPAAHAECYATTLIIIWLFLPKIEGEPSFRQRTGGQSSPARGCPPSTISCP